MATMTMTEKEVMLLLLITGMILLMKVVTTIEGKEMIMC